MLDHGNSSSKTKVSASTEGCEQSQAQSVSKSEHKIETGLKQSHKPKGSL